MMQPSIYSYIKGEENRFDTDEIRLGENWTWNLKNHVQMIFHLKNSQFFTGENNWLRSFKNIMEPILNLAYWTEDIEVKDLVFFIENPKGRALSFLIKKYHDEVFVKENDMDTFIDEIAESDIDYGGVLVQKTSKPRPEVLPLQSLAFCDQTDMLGGPRAFKHHFTPTRLRAMAKNGWGEQSNGATITIEELITLADNKSSAHDKSRENTTSGKVIEVYILKGCLPQHYLKDDDDYENYYEQVHVVAFYTNAEGKEEGVTLYRKEESEANMKFFTSKKVYGRALGRGVGESLLHPQVWTNFLTIHKNKLLEAAAKVPLVTDDPNFQNRNKIQDMENLEVTTIDEGKSIVPVNTAAVANIQLYQNSINEWFEHAQFTGSAFDPILGKEATSGTTFRGQERTVAQGRGIHDRRRGQRAKFIEEVYRDWIIPRMVSQIFKGKKFLATLTSEEMLWISEQLAENYAHSKRIEDILNLKIPQDKETLKAEFLDKFSKKGNKHMIEILKDEFRDIDVKMGINIAGKQKDLVNLSDKLLSIFQFVFANPQAFQQAMQVPSLNKAFNDILEFSGMNQADFNNFAIPQSLAQPQQPQQAQPIQLNQTAEV